MAALANRRIELIGLCEMFGDTLFLAFQERVQLFCSVIRGRRVCFQPILGCDVAIRSCCACPPLWRCYIILLRTVAWDL